MAGMTGGPSEPNYRRNLENTRIGLTAELDAAAGFGGGVVVHIGSAKDKSLGMSTISSTIEDVLTRTSSTTFQLSRGLDIPEQEFIESRKIILENAAGEGNKIGSNLDEIAEIIRNTREELHPQIKVMIDTAHLFGAGEGDMGSPKSVKKFFQEFDEKIGLSYLEGFHLNDSRVPFRSRKDRHENIGKGYIFGNLREEGDGLDGLKKLIDFSREQELVLIGEPPGKTRDGEKGMGGIWDYQVIKHVCGLDTCKFVCCD
jgi:endonuclease IV